MHATTGHCLKENKAKGNEKHNASIWEIEVLLFYWK